MVEKEIEKIVAGESISQPLPPTQSSACIAESDSTLLKVSAACSRAARNWLATK